MDERLPDPFDDQIDDEDLHPERDRIQIIDERDIEKRAVMVHRQHDPHRQQIQRHRHAQHAHDARDERDRRRLREFLHLLALLDEGRRQDHGTGIVVDQADDIAFQQMDRADVRPFGITDMRIWVPCLPIQRLTQVAFRKDLRVILLLDPLFKISEHIRIGQRRDITVDHITRCMLAFAHQRKAQVGITDAAADHPDIEDDVFHEPIVRAADAALDAWFRAGPGRIAAHFDTIPARVPFQHHHALPAHEAGDGRFLIPYLLYRAWIQRHLQAIFGRDDKAFGDRRQQPGISERRQKDHLSLDLLDLDAAKDDVKARTQPPAQSGRALCQRIHDFGRNSTAMTNANKIPAVMPAAVRSNIPNKMPMSPFCWALASAPWMSE